jgi:hypothetical protein
MERLQPAQHAAELPPDERPRRRKGKLGFVLWGAVLVAVMSVAAAGGLAWQTRFESPAKAMPHQTQVSIQVTQNVPYTVFVTNEAGKSVGVFNGSQSFTVDPGEYQVEIVAPGFEKQTRMMRFDRESVVGVPITLIPANLDP